MVRGERLWLAPQAYGEGTGCSVIAGTWPLPGGSSSPRWRLLHVSSSCLRCLHPTSSSRRFLHVASSRWRLQHVSSPSQRCLHATSSCRRFLHVASSRCRLLLASSPCLRCLRVSSSCRRFLRLAALGVSQGWGLGIPWLSSGCVGRGVVRVFAF